MILRPVTCFLLLAATAAPALGDGPSLWKMFGRRGVEAKVNKSYELTEVDGPWMILAANFAGEGAKGRAERLALEIRRDMKLPAFIHHEHFDFTGKVSKRVELAEKLRYANQYEYEAYAVLVGEYDTVEHPAIDRDLAAIKVAKPSVLTDAAEVAAETATTNPVTTLKAMHQRFADRKADKSKGPMAGAFVTRNPMLPDDYFDAPEVDSFVRQLNEDKSHSLLDCEGKFTVVVKTFEGMGKLVSAATNSNFEPSSERMDKYAADADKMVRELRAQGVDAYQFHDRTRSIVTVGSFDTLGRELPGGDFEYDPAIRSVAQEYSAFNSKVAHQYGQGIAANHIAMIPYDVKPTPIAVPKATKRSFYNSTFGMK